MTCHLCESDLSEAPIVGTIARGGKPSRRVCCPRCALVQTSPAPTPAELAAYYASGDFWAEHSTTGLIVSDASGAERFVEHDSPEHAAVIEMMHRQRAQRVVADLELELGDRVLEIGCSDGRTLVELQKLGMDVYGLEPDPHKAGEAGEALGLDSRVVCRSLEDFTSMTCVRCDARADEARNAGKAGYAKCGGCDFDAVIAFHVLEHFPAPIEALAQMRSLLKPGGRVWVEVPNVERPGLPLSDHWMWVHTFDFSRYTIAALLHRAGFDNINATDAGNLPSRPERLLRAWGTHGSNGPREYIENDGPTGAEVAAVLHALEADEPAPVVDTRGRALQAVRDGRMPDLEALAADVRGYDESVAAMAKVYDEAIALLGDLAGVLNEEAIARLEGWTADAEHQAFAMGEAHQLWRVRSMLGHVSHALTARKISQT